MSGVNPKAIGIMMCTHLDKAFHGCNLYLKSEVFVMVPVASQRLEWLLPWTRIRPNWGPREIDFGTIVIEPASHDAQGYEGHRRRAGRA